jgi:hypothetical protein
MFYDRLYCVLISACCWLRYGTNIKKKFLFVERLNLWLICKIGSLFFCSEMPTYCFVSLLSLPCTPCIVHPLIFRSKSLARHVTELILLLGGLRHFKLSAYICIHVVLNLCVCSLCHSVFPST